MKMHITVREVHAVTYLVEADTLGDAIGMVTQGQVQGEYIGGDYLYPLSHYTEITEDDVVNVTDTDGEKIYLSWEEVEPETRMPWEHY